jgi:hypothetical protein
LCTLLAKNVAHQEERIPIPIGYGYTISNTPIYSEDVRTIMDWEQPVGVISDTIELQELIANIRGGWIREEGLLLQIHTKHSKEPHFHFSRLKREDTSVELIPD